MGWIDGLLAALSAYSAVPVPYRDWNAETMRRALCWFPAVGILCGGALAGWNAACRTLGVGGVLFAAGAACIPPLMTGGIHMDGFLDTVDALSSRQSRERMLEILRDSRCGAFAVLFCGMYLLFSAGLLHELYGAGLIPALCPGFVLSRALSALCAVTMPNARGDGTLLASTVQAKRREVIPAALAAAAASCCAMTALAPVPGICAAALAAGSMLYYRALARRRFGGATGDTAGFFLQICELAIAVGVWLGSLLAAG